MQEAYDCADRNEVESYNSIKVMCSEVLRLAEEMVLAEREACAKVCEAYSDESDSDHEYHGYTCAEAIRARGQE
jgi:hypothetical protein